MIQYIYVYCANTAQWDEYATMLQTRYGETLSFVCNRTETSVITRHTTNNSTTIYLKILPSTGRTIYDHYTTDVVWLCDKELFNDEKGDKL